MRRSIYSADESTKFGVATAVAGADQTVESIAAITNLDGTGSSTTSGSISSYEWSIISGTGLVIDSPTSSTTSVSGTSIIGESVIQLRVVDTNGNVSVDTLTIEIVLGTPLQVSFTQPDGSGNGTIDYTNGQPNEVLDLNFSLKNGDYPDSITFVGYFITGALSYSTPNQLGSITLDGSGNGSVTYSTNGEFFQVNVVVTARSSSYPIPNFGENVDISVYS